MNVPIHKKKKKGLLYKLRTQKYLLLLLLPALIVTFVFKYIPMYGILMAFVDFNPLKGILNSTWVGFKYFEDFLNSPNFDVLLFNTLKLSVYGLLWGFLPPILLALMLNQVLSEKIKSRMKIIFYSPNFISTVIIVGMLNLFFSVSGPVNGLLESIGINTPQWLTSPDLFRPLYIFSGIWQGMGWASVLYTSALASVPPELYEAAEMDGATTLQKIRFIELPTLRPLMLVNLILAVGGIMNVGYEKAYLMQSSLNLPASEIISTYVYKVGLQNGNYSYSTAVGLFNSIINVILLLVAYGIIHQLNKGGE